MATDKISNVIDIISKNKSVFVSCQTLVPIVYLVHAGHTFMGLSP